MKNIAIIVPTLNKGGAEKVAANLSIEFSKYYNVYIIVHDESNITYEYSGNLINLNILPSKNVIKKIFNLYKRIHLVKKIKKKYNIDYSISHLPSSNWVNVFSRSNDKVFTYVHSMLKPKLKIKIREKIIAFFSDKVICVSECAKKNMIDNFKISENKLITIYNFSYPIKLKSNEKHKKSNEILLVTMGRLTEAKGQWHLINAMKYINEINKNVKLKIFGDGELKDCLKSQIDKLNLNEYISLCGYISNPFDELSKGDIYVSSSLWEGLPMSLIEAGFCNLPIVSTDCDSGCREILAPKTPINKKTDKIEYAEYGLLVPVCKSGLIGEINLTDEEKILGDAILELIKNEKKRLMYAKLANARSYEFIPEKIMNRWKNILL